MRGQTYSYLYSAIVKTINHKCTGSLTRTQRSSPAGGGGGLSLPDLLHHLQHATDLPQRHLGGVVRQAGARREAGAPVGEQGQVAVPPGSSPEQLQGLGTAAIAGRKLGATGGEDRGQKSESDT